MAATKNLSKELHLLRLWIAPEAKLPGLEKDAI
jgi:hypothetical protein